MFKLFISCLLINSYVIKIEANSEDYISHLPIEIIDKILEYLPYEDIINFKMTSKDNNKKVCDYRVSQSKKTIITRAPAKVNFNKRIGNKKCSLIQGISCSLVTGTGAGGIAGTIFGTTNAIISCITIGAIFGCISGFSISNYFTLEQDNNIEPRNQRYDRLSGYMLY